jgi:hypothetical protein
LVKMFCLVCSLLRRGQGRSRTRQLPTDVPQAHQRRQR